MISEVYNMDCVAGMKEYPDKYFDLAIVDPEYGLDIANRNGSIGQKKGQGKITKYKAKKWDAKPAGKSYFSELFRVSKNQIIWGGNYFTTFLPPAMGWIVWDKLQPEGVTFAMADLAFSSIHKSIKTFKTSRDQMQNCVSNNTKVGLSKAKIHPTQKPISLYRWLLLNYAEKGKKY